MCFIALCWSEYYAKKPHFPAISLYYWKTLLEVFDTQRPLFSLESLDLIQWWELHITDNGLIH